MLRVARVGIDRTILGLAIMLIVALLACVMLGVITRALNDPLIWTDEMSRFLMVWLAVAGWLLATRRRAHVRIRFFHDLLPKPAWRFVELAIQVSVLLLGVLVTWHSIDVVARNYDMDALTVPISMSCMYAPLILAGLVTIGQAICEICENLHKPSASGASSEAERGA